MKETGQCRAWQRWQPVAAACLLSWFGAVAGAAVPDYSLYDEILLQNVRNGFVDYDGIGADPRFQAFIQQLGATEPADLSTINDQLAFYINAYNALSIQNILDGYSPSGWFGRRKFFRGVRHEVHGESLTLDQIEHERLRKLGDARIHFAIVCAALSCPRLLNRAYTPERVDFQLHDAARNFVNDMTRNRFDPEGRIAVVSMIFKWFGEDFEAAGGSVQRYISRFVGDPEVADMLREDGFELRYDDYDWNLNGTLSRTND